MPGGVAPAGVAVAPRRRRPSLPSTHPLATCCLLLCAVAGPARALISSQLNTSAPALFADWGAVVFIEPGTPDQPDFVCTATLVAPTVALTSPSCFDPATEAPQTATPGGLTLPLAPRPVFAGDAGRTLVGWAVEHAYVNRPSVEGDRLSVVRLELSPAGAALALRPL